MSPVFPEGSQGCCAASMGQTGLVWGGKHRLGVPVNSAHETGSPGQRGGFEMSPAPVPMLVPQRCCVVQPGLLGGPVPQMGAVLQGAHVLGWGYCRVPFHCSNRLGGLASSPVAAPV